MIFLATLMGSHAAWAEGPPAPSSMSNPFVVTMVIIIGILALAIGLLANVVLGAAFVRVKEDKEAEEKSGSKRSAGTSAAVIIGLLLISSTLFGQDKTMATTAATSTAAVANGVSDTAFYLITAVIFLELIVVIVLVYNLKLLLNLKRKESAVVESSHAAAAVPLKPALSWWDRFNKLRPIDQEVNIDLGHNYDGIRELDNRLPPWWIYGFYLTIIFAGIYLWRYHVAHSAPLSGEEFQIAMQQAAVQKEEYLKKTASNIDETNVKYLSSAADLDAGKKVFETVCFACHGKGGEGLVGPNLTDDYWLHGGSIQDIFKTIKYGYPEKGMKSWKDDYSPIQIAQISSYVKSLHGTNPPNPKAPQGTLSNEGTDGNSKPTDQGVKDSANAKTVVIR